MILQQPNGQLALVFSSINLFLSFSLGPLHPAVQTEHQYRIIACITKHLQQQRRNRESNAINSQNIPQSQGAMRSNLVSRSFSERQRAETQRYIVSLKQRKPDHPKISCVEEAPRSIDPYAQDQHEKSRTILERERTSSRSTG